MPAFHFRLDRVLEWYRTQLRLEENRLASYLANLNLVHERIVRLQDERVSAERAVTFSTAIRASDLAYLDSYRSRVKAEAATLEQELIERERVVQAQRFAIQKAQRRVKLVEKLRDRRLAEYRYEEDRSLENLAAESYLAKFAARTNNANLQES